MAKRSTRPEPEPEPEPEWRVINIPIPSELHRQLKIRAAMDDMSLRATVTAAIENYVAS